MTTKEKLIEAIDKLPEDKISELLRIAVGFKKKSKAVKKSKWAEFAGSLTDEDARIMKAAIEEEFEKVEDES
jgi:hypothetical protein